MFNWNKKEKPLQGLMGVGGGATGLLYGGPTGGAAGFSLDVLPSAYQTLHNNSVSAGYTMVYIDKEGGNDSNNGTSFSTPKQNYYNLFNSIGQGLAASTCIVVRGFHYRDLNSSGNGLGVIDNDTSAIRIIAFPGQTLIRATNSSTSGRDFHISAGHTTATEVFGAILEKVRESWRTTNYMTAFHAPASKATFRNCVFRSVDTSNRASDPDTNSGVRSQSNSLFSMHYDNSNTISTDSFNCTKLGNWNGNNYTGGSNCDLFNCNGNDSSTTTSGSNTTNSFGVTINSNFSASNNSKGVYGGTYAWDASSFNARYSYGNPYE
jgi:hypothetical protein